MNRSLFTSLMCLLVTVFAVPASADDRDDRNREQYELMKLFVESYQQIESNYVTEVDRRELIEAAIRGMIEHLDQYSNYIPPAGTKRFNQVVEQEFGGIGVNIDPSGPELKVASPLPGSPAIKAGIRSGDTILAVDGTELADISRGQAIRMIQGPAGRPVKLTVRRANDESSSEEITVVRRIIQIPTVHGLRLKEDRQWNFMYSDEDKIGYVHLTHFSRHSAEELKKIVQQLLDREMRGLVLDLRSNPGGLLDVAISICDLFLDEGNIVSVRGRNVPERSWDASTADTFPEFPLAILVNRTSASASEVVSAALQDNDRAVVIGERTWGKGSVQNVIELEGGHSQLKLTMASYHRPSGVNIHRLKDAEEDDDWGVRPNEGFEIRFDTDQFRQWESSLLQRRFHRHNDNSDPENKFTDTQLAAAVEYLQQQFEKPDDAETPQASDN